MICKIVISQHAEESADLWSLRNGLIRRSEISLREIARLDERIEAHLDGLRIAGIAARDVCDAILPGDSAGEVFARFIWARTTNVETEVDWVIQIAESSLEKAKGLSSALGWLAFGDAEATIRRLLIADSPILRRAGIAAAAAHRHHPGPCLREAILSNDQYLRARSLRAVGEIGALSELPYVFERFGEGDGDMAEQFWAAWSSAILSWDYRANEVLTATIEHDAPTFAELALPVVLRRMQRDQADQWIEALFRNGKHQRLAVIALGIQGDTRNLPRLLELMESGELARLAGAAFRMITGQDLKREYLNKPAPNIIKSEPSDVDKDDEDSPDQDRDLPWPDVAKVKARWNELKTQFAPGDHYLLGKVIATDSLQDVLLMGHQRERSAAAIALAVRETGLALFNCAAPARRQYRALR